MVNLSQSAWRKAPPLHGRFIAAAAASTRARGNSKTLAAAAAAAAALTSPPPAPKSSSSSRYATAGLPQMASPPSSSTSSDPAAPPLRPSWVILGSIPRVVQGGGGNEAADLSLALAAPPRVSRLTVSERVFPDRPTPQNFPFLLAADPSGLLLLSALLAAPRTRVDIDRPDHQSFHWRDFDARFFVLDATTGSAFRLPDPAPQDPIEHQALVGVLARPGGYMVAELLPLHGSDTADLRCYSSDVGEWVHKSVHYPRPLEPLCTLAHAGRLWWADYSWGIVTGDPIADEPVLRFVPLPRPCVLEYNEAPGVLDQFRYVGVSAGKLRFVDTFRRGGASNNKVTVWTLPDADATKWTLEHEATFADIWADDSYKATGLPKKVPVLALIHPHIPAVIYFFLKNHLFGVDVRARKVVECKRYHLVAPPRDYPIANRFIRAWELPESVSSDLGNWPSDIGSTEPAEVPPSQRRRGDYHLVGNSRMSAKLFRGAVFFVPA